MANLFEKELEVVIYAYFGHYSYERTDGGLNSRVNHLIAFRMNNLNDLMQIVIKILIYSGSNCLFHIYIVINI